MYSTLMSRLCLLNTKLIINFNVSTRMLYSTLWYFWIMSLRLSTMDVKSLIPGHRLV